MPPRDTTNGGDDEPPASLRSQHVEATRRAVLGAARSLFGAGGYAQTSVDEIAAAARVTKGAVYHHFASKEALFRAVHAEVETEAQLRAVQGRDPVQPPIDQIVGMVNGYLDAALDPEIRRITLIDGPALLGFEPDIPDGAQAAQIEAVRAFVAGAIERGELVDVDPDLLTQLIGGVALEGGLLIARSPEPDRTRAQLGRAIDALLRGGLAPRDRG
jgi:AcrR family transcriptional regulator